MENLWILKKNLLYMVIMCFELDWEISGCKVIEGVEILQYNGCMFMMYLVSFCNILDYKLGMFEFVGDDLFKVSSWKKYDKLVFECIEEVFGLGYNGFFILLDGIEDWLVYYGNDLVEYGCSVICLLCV